jgi:hypothetical protein
MIFGKKNQDSTRGRVLLIFPKDLGVSSNTPFLNTKRKNE